MEYDAIIYEHGNGYPQDGDYVGDCNGRVYQIVSSEDRVHIGTGMGEPNYIYAVVSELDWDDVEGDEDDLFPSQVEILKEKP